MFFRKRSQGLLGSKCPITNAKSTTSVSAQQSNRPMSAKTYGNTAHDAVVTFQNKNKKGIILLKPRVAINTYKMHQTLFNVAQDELIASSVLE